MYFLPIWQTFYQGLNHLPSKFQSPCMCQGKNEHIPETQTKTCIHPSIPTHQRPFGLNFFWSFFCKMFCMYGHTCSVKLTAMEYVTS